MKDEKIKGLLGIARRARCLCLGHDAVLDAIRAGNACLCLLAADASERLERELRRAAEAFGNKIPIYKTAYTMNEIGSCLGAKKTAVLSVNDRGFAEKLIEHIGRECVYDKKI